MAVRQRQLRKPQHQRAHAWILGNSMASLASAVHLIQETSIPASHVNVVESRTSATDGLSTTGNATIGYDYRAACLPIFCDGCTEDLLSIIPSTSGPGKTLLDNLKCTPREIAPTRVIIKRGHKEQVCNARGLRMGWKVRIKLALFLRHSEGALGRKTIRDCLDNEFFKSAFWAVWASTFGFSPWHSAVEFRRCLRSFLHEILQSSTDPAALNCCTYNAHEDIIMPMTRFLQSQGADLKFNSKTTLITMGNDTGCQREGIEKTVTIGPHDVVIATLGSAISGSSSGTSTDPPPQELLPAVDYFDENWSLWLGLFPNLGDPYSFCTRVTESRAECFTITSRQCDFFAKLTQENPEKIVSIVLPGSEWSISLFRPHCKTINGSSGDERIIWGHASSPGREGNYVKKPMLDCGGMEILAELLQHFHAYSEDSLSHFTLIPRVAPRLAAPLLARNYKDRPKVVGNEAENLAVVGQFVEIPDETAATMDYSVRSAQLAVYRLMGLRKEPRTTRKASASDILRW
ncbi:67 kDa myosin-cross-reactive antigen like protein [Aspergillus vadensis CBS 113365]|uniref:67 kDa myosin-cross-reactive antigen like protein n=1 Tax=Aspergillus vadensis (strain CBS 113365 / IMI 142717 / IBT 24658) TaxID=1448311 RepID=A0A319B312_ASPVC|nr:67 kDa myosin-cross-reactive antigen like protein [Aspergillus vadensis CBS 113365]PYH67117.1 67 kDa myosin-cross-reactive antigen like protein [Aspergillus vadensis CBS 113365]